MRDVSLRPDRAWLDRMRQAASSARDLSLFVLHGSRARGDAHERSDWDFAYLGGPDFDPDGLLATLVEVLGAERVDLADLSRAGALLRYRVARDGVPIVEHEPGAFTTFRLQAIDAWCDLAPVLEPAYGSVLDRFRDR
jgi:predicted nucleotidyltransferase